MDPYENGRALGKLLEPRRNSYFYGKLLDVGHLDMEQSYFNRKRWLLNRLALGSGVLCGLQLTVNGKKLRVVGGAAIDGYGREIVVPAAVELDPWTVTGSDGQNRTLDKTKTEPQTVYVCLEYCECRTDFQPALVTECKSEPQGMPGTVVESYVLHLREGEPPETEHDAKLCEALTTGADPAEKQAKLCGVVDALGCPDGEIDPCVVLGTVILEGAENPDDASIGEIKDCVGRSVLYSNERLFELLLCAPQQGGGGTPPPPPVTYTRITEISGWRHDGVLAMKAFPPALVVSFSNAVTATTTNGLAWFVVTLEIPTRGVSSITSSLAATAGPATGLRQRLILEGTVKVSGKNATFRVAQPFMDAVAQLPDPTSPPTQTFLCRVMVKCDFLLDGKKRAVDGNYLGGTLPTGDGVPGGEFESWFSLTM